ncbi:HlyD family type I secretion periplasmic adaptor subunit [Amaricoccus sp.]|uniref:HlyD family type I secretion periplasmic adaptor subunit n=1 Tax=Amaricoccus sp. TaxID=1872485 RepID=UPI0026358EA5|nr:HlyD family type I secretion periplasmic adaptor subunit [Amaricoccus sp.]HRO09888.1 HlyD family type I secretion periplasmic adaptor subunit [Amaricoccus sp.]
MNAQVRDRWGLKRLMLLGYFTLFLLVFGIGAWGAVSRIAGAVVGAGALEVQGNRQVVQHPTGGVIKEIHARDGDKVEAGDVLIELDGEDLHPQLLTVEGQWFEMLARKSRLQAERDQIDSITFDAELTSRQADSAEIRALMAAQQQQFAARLKSRKEEESQLLEQQTQIGNQNEGLVALQAATKEQIGLLTREITGQQTLLDKGLTEVTRVLTPQRELARLQGVAGQVEANIAENRGKIAEIEIQRVRLVSKAREDAIAELRELEFQEIETRESRRQLLDRMARLYLRAPVTGTVYGSSADTVRAVIRAAEPVMYVVPKDSPLIVRTHIDTIHIDQVHVGQEAFLRFSAFDQRTTPELRGRVIDVSADAYSDERTGQRYYKADVELDAKEAERLAHVTLLPGMPVEAFIQTGSRSALSYVVKPMADYFTRAFRDD